MGDDKVFGGNCMMSLTNLICGTTLTQRLPSYVELYAVAVNSSLYWRLLLLGYLKKKKTVLDRFLTIYMGMN